MRVGVDAVHIAAGGSGCDNNGDAPVTIHTRDGAAVSVIDVDDVVVAGVVVGIVSAGVIAVAACCGFEGGEEVLGGGFAAHRRAEGGRLRI